MAEVLLVAVVLERTEPITTDEVIEWGGLTDVDDDQLQVLIDVVVDHAGILYDLPIEYPPGARHALVTQCARQWERHAQALAAAPSEESCEPGPQVQSVVRQGVAYQFAPVDVLNPALFDDDVTELLAPYLKFCAA